MAATEAQIKELAETIVGQAQALADGKVVGPRHSAIKRIADNVDTLAAWIGDDR